jgi:imidazolonepropionase-like amidohydrolase
MNSRHIYRKEQHIQLQVPAPNLFRKRTFCMRTFRISTIVTSLIFSVALLPATAVANTFALTDLRIIDGTGSDPIEVGTVIVREGLIETIGQAADITIPPGMVQHRMPGKTLMPGLINSHGHVGGVRGLETGHYSEENLLDQLALYARYGITTVISLGDDEAAGFHLRDTQDTPALNRARLYVAGPVLSARNAEEARAVVDRTAQQNPDFIKIRVDDNLGRTSKMPAEVYQAISERADHHGIPLAVHTYYLQDTKELLRAGADFVAHSVRDVHVDDEFIALMLQRNICYSPTLTRELSTFVYEDVPGFFADPFFLRDADTSVLDTLREPQRQQRMRENTAAQQYKASLPVAMSNLKMLADAGVSIAMGTDSGPPARFQGYFEHLEMWMMQDAGMSPAQILYSATGGAAACMNLENKGTLEPGNWADMILLGADPLSDVRNTSTLETVWIAGNRIEI